MARAKYGTMFKNIGPLVCETCQKETPGGRAQEVFVTEDDGVSWKLWLLPNGWSESDISTKTEIAVCGDDQYHQCVKALTGMDDESIAPGLRGVTEEEYNA